MNNKAANVGETEVGVGGTSQWKFCSLTPNTTPVIALEIVNQVSDWSAVVGATPLPICVCRTKVVDFHARSFDAFVVKYALKYWVFFKVGKQWGY